MKFVNEESKAKEAYDEAFNLQWVAKLIDSNISDETPAIPMTTFKRFLNISAEDGNYFRAITVLNNLVVKLNEIETHVDQSFDAIEAKL